MDDQQDAPQAPFDQAAKDVFPLLEILTSEAEEAGQDALLAVAAEAHDQVDRGRPEPVPLFDLDVLGIEKEGQQVGIERARVAQLQLFEEFSGDGFQVLFGSGQTDAAEGRLSGVERAAGSQQGEHQGLGLLGVIALIGGRQKGGAKAARARARAGAAPRALPRAARAQEVRAPRPRRRRRPSARSCAKGLARPARRRR